MVDQFDWLMPSTLWDPRGDDARRPEFYRPTLLEFTSDDFMTQFLEATSAPTRSALDTRLARPSLPGQTLKLFQPGHGRFYLVCGSLCCRSPGFPDRDLRVRDDESAYFVLRKLIGGAEHGWCVGASPGWKPVGPDARVVLEGEERLPLLSAPATEGRSLFSGYVPVASSESYPAPATELTGASPPLDTRIEELEARFIGPVTNPKILQPVNDPLVRRSFCVYLLLDLLEYLESYLPEVAAAVVGTGPSTFTGDRAPEKSALLNFFQETLNDALTWAAAFSQVNLERGLLTQTGGVASSALEGLGFGPSYDLRGVPVRVSTLRNKVAATLAPELPAVEVPKLDRQATTRYVIRFVFERPKCDPIERIVGLASAPFVLASFFDPDAPARPLKIPLPSDVSVAGLRRAKKGVTFLLSDGLRKKIEGISASAKDIIKEDSPSISEGGGDFAFICSFSIYIICIVAFCLLIMFVIILNIVFWWMAFFKICLPVPKSWLPD